MYVFLQASAEEARRSLTAAGDCEAPKCWCWELYSGPLEEQEALLVPEPLREGFFLNALTKAS